MRVHFAGYDGVRPGVPPVVGDPAFDLGDVPVGGGDEFVISFRNIITPYLDPTTGKVVIPEVDNAQWTDLIHMAGYAPGSYDIPEEGMDLVLLPDPPYTVINEDGSPYDPETAEPFHFE